MPSHRVGQQPPRAPPSPFYTDPSLPLSPLVMIIHRARENPEVELPPFRTESFQFIILRLAALQVAAIVRRE